MASRRVSTPLRRLTLVILGVTALVAGEHCPLQAADKIRLSVTNFNMSFLPAGIAVKRGFFKEEGLETEVIRMNANVAIAALAGGGVDYTMIFFFKGGTFPGRRCPLFGKEGKGRFSDGLTWSNTTNFWDECLALGNRERSW